MMENLRKCLYTIGLIHMLAEKFDVTVPWMVEFALRLFEAFDGELDKQEQVFLYGTGPIQGPRPTRMWVDEILDIEFSLATQEFPTDHWHHGLHIRNENCIPYNCRKAEDGDLVERRIDGPKDDRVHEWHHPGTEHR